MSRLVFAVALLSAPSAPALAGPLYVHFSGNFTQDDDRADFLFTIASPATVELRSWSYAGGPDLQANPVPRGGFAPVLSLFDGAGNLLAYDNGGSVGGTAPRDCSTGARAQDVVSDLCLDAYTQAALGSAGSYRVVVTEQDNLPNGPTLADGFALSGAGDFTGGPFIDAGGNPRSAYFYFTIGPVDAAQAASAPEPAPLWLLASGLGLVLQRRMRASR
ncbi:MAG: DVUA0089 family protein [Candidatus Solibacter sp.]